MLSILRQRNFALLWWGGTLSRTGTFMLYAALPYFVYATSGLVTASGLAVMSEVLPSILFNTLGGVFADRLPRKSVMALGVAVLIGGPFLWIDAGISTLLQAGVRSELRGRMYGSYHSAANLAGLTGNVIATYFTDEVGIRLMIGVAGAILALAGIAGLSLLPSRPAIFDGNE